MDITQILVAASAFAWGVWVGYEASSIHRGHKLHAAERVAARILRQSRKRRSRISALHRVVRMSLYERLARVGIQMTEGERAEIGAIETTLRALGVKYDDDDLLELADECAAVSAPIVVGDGTGVR